MVGALELESIAITEGEVLVGLTVTIVIDSVAGLFTRHARLTHAVDALCTADELAIPFTRTDSNHAGVANSGNPFVGLAVAVIIDLVASFLGRIPGLCVAHQPFLGVADDRAISFAGAFTLGAGIADAVDAVIRDAIAVVIQAIADLSAIGLTRLYVAHYVRRCAYAFTLTTADANSHDTGLAHARNIVVYRAVTVVIFAIAHLGGGIFELRHADGVLSIFAADEHTGKVTGQQVDLAFLAELGKELIDLVVAVVVDAVTPFARSGTACTARVERALIYFAIAVVVDVIADFGACSSHRVALRHITAVAGNDRMPASTHATDDLLTLRVLVYRAVTVVVLAVAGVVVLGVTGNGATHCAAAILGADDFAISVADANAHAARFAETWESLVRLPVAVVVFAIADLVAEFATATTGVEDMFIHLAVTVVVFAVADLLGRHATAHVWIGSICGLSIGGCTIHSCVFLDALVRGAPVRYFAVDRHSAIGRNGPIGRHCIGQTVVASHPLVGGSDILIEGTCGTIDRCSIIVTDATVAIQTDAHRAVITSLVKARGEQHGHQAQEAQSLHVKDHPHLLLVESHYEARTSEDQNLLSQLLPLGRSCAPSC